MLIDNYQPNTINLHEHRERGPLGRFRPRFANVRDALGRKLVVVDLLEVERRLKERSVNFFQDHICPSTGKRCPTPRECFP